MYTPFKIGFNKQYGPYASLKILARKGRKINAVLLFFFSMPFI